MAEKRVSTVVRTFELLDVLSEADCATPTKLAEELEMPVSSVHDYLSTLVAMGYAVKEDGCYSISARMFKFPGKMRIHNDLFNASKRIVKQLARETGDQAAIGLKEDNDIVFLYIYNENDQYDIKNYPGMTLPLHASASGKLVLSSYSNSQLKDYVQENSEKFTDQTQTDFKSLKEELKIVKEQGYAYNREEYETGLQTVAAPIELDGELLGTLCLTTPTNRMADNQFKDNIINQLLQAANVIEINLKDHPNLTDSM